jgi:hypothetical protein
MGKPILTATYVVSLKLVQFYFRGAAEAISDKSVRCVGARSVTLSSAFARAEAME